MTGEGAPLPTAHAPKPDKKYFTVEEANRAIAYVSRVADDVTATYARVVRLRRELTQADVAAGERLEASYESAMDELAQLVDELQAVGVELKDFERGLVDFPAVHEGREILLCWQRGEREVSHWHEVEAGYAGRQPVDQLGD
ncbi:MAG: DUF2203 domain-containing protein [Phycisphaeraceae bacterium]